MGVDKLGFLSGWKLTLVEFFKLLIEHGCMRKQDIAKFGIYGRTELEWLDISEEEWQQGVDELIAEGKAEMLPEGFWKVKDGSREYHIFPLEDKPEDFMASDIIDALREHFDLNLVETRNQNSYIVGWLHKPPGHDNCNNNLSDSYVLIGKIETTCNLHDLEEGFVVPYIINTECPDVLSFLSDVGRFRRCLYVLSNVYLPRLRPT